MITLLINYGERCRMLHDYRVSGFGFVRHMFKGFCVVIFLILFGVLFSFHQKEAVAAGSSPLTLTYSDKVHTYKGVQGKLNLMHKDYKFTTMPIVKLDGVLYAPAQELFQKILGCSWDYNTETTEYHVYDDDLDVMIQFKAGEKSFTLISGGNVTAVSLSKPILMIQNGTSEVMPCIPITKVLKTLKFTTS